MSVYIELLGSSKDQMEGQHWPLLTLHLINPIKQRSMLQEEGPWIRPDHTFTLRSRLLLQKTPHDTNEGYVYRFPRGMCSHNITAAKQDV